MISHADSAGRTPLDFLQAHRARIGPQHAQFGPPKSAVEPGRSDGAGPPKARAHGLVRKLMDESFNGAAASRLRTKFHDQLTAASGSNPSAEGSDLLAELTSLAKEAFSKIQLSELPAEKATQVAEIRERLAGLIAEAKAVLESGGEVSADELNAAVREIVNELSALLAPGGDKTTEPGVPEVARGAVPADVAAAATQLRSAATAIFDRFQAAATDVKTLPPKLESPPNGGDQGPMSPYQIVQSAAGVTVHPGLDIRG